MKPRLIHGPIPREEETRLRLLLAGGYEFVPYDRAAQAPGPEPLAALLRAPNTAQEFERMLKTLRRRYPDLPTVLVQSEAQHIPLGLVFEAGVRHVVLAETALADGGHRLKRTLASIREPAAALHLPHLGVKPEAVRAWRIKTREDKAQIGRTVRAVLESGGFDRQATQHVLVCLEETLNNGFFHAFRTDDGGEKYTVAAFEALAESECLDLEYALVGSAFFFAVRDNAGSLPLEVLEQRLRVDEEDAHAGSERGRGLFLVRALCSEVVFNLVPGRMTEFLMVIDSPARLARTRPLHINVVPPEALGDVLDDDLDRDLAHDLDSDLDL